MLHVARIGPVELEDARTNFYVGMVDGFVLPPVMGEDDARALAELAAQAKGHSLQCDAALAAAGTRLGFTTAVRPDELKAMLTGLALSILQGPSEAYRDPELLLPYLGGVTLFHFAAPWRWWRDSEALSVTVEGRKPKEYEAAIMGAGGEQFGLALYDEKGALARIASAPRKPPRIEDILKTPCIGVTLDFEPAWAVEIFEQAIRLPAIPNAMRIAKGDAGIPSPRELLVLGAALEACSKLSPEKLEARAEVTTEGQSVAVHVKAPAPRAMESSTRGPSTSGPSAKGPRRARRSPVKK